MKIKAISPWFGSKRLMADAIAAQLGPHRAYFELFAGSMAVLLAKPIASSETVCDLHGGLVNLARIIADDDCGARLYRRLRRTLVHEQIYLDSCKWLVDFKGLQNKPYETPFYEDWAYHFFVASWLGRNGVQGTKKAGIGFTRRFTACGGHSGTRFASSVDSIPSWRRRMREVTILGSCGLECAERIEDAPGVAIYADPPYLVKGADYVHDFNWEDHVRLAEALNRFRKARVVVSYFSDPRLKDLYPGWTVLDCERASSLGNQGQRGSKEKLDMNPEVLLVNGPEFTTEDQLF